MIQANVRDDGTIEISGIKFAAMDGAGRFVKVFARLRSFNKWRDRLNIWQDSDSHKWFISGVYHWEAEFETASAAQIYLDCITAVGVRYDHMTNKISVISPAAKEAVK